MKVALNKDYRNYSLNQIDQMKAVIAAEKEDEETAKGWAIYAINEAIKNEVNSIVEIYKATAETAMNCRIWNAYGEGTGYADVWIEAVAETTAGFVKVGAYLSDIWQTGAEPYNEFMYIEKYNRA